MNRQTDPSPGLPGPAAFGPFVRYFVKLGMKELGLWGKPLVILSYKKTATDVVDLLKRNWELGHDPVAVFDYRLMRLTKPLDIELADQRAPKLQERLVNVVPLFAANLQTPVTIRSRERPFDHPPIPLQPLAGFNVPPGDAGAYAPLPQCLSTASEVVTGGRLPFRSECCNSCSNTRVELEKLCERRSDD